MDLADLEFDLPEELIALRPADPRPSARLLVSETGRLRDLHVSDLPTVLRPGDRLILNDTKVIPALLRGVRQRPGSGGVNVSVNLDRPLDAGAWLALARPARRIRPGDVADFGPGLQADFGERRGEFFVLKFRGPPDRFQSALDSAGQVPLPPYITSRRQIDRSDRSDYQTVFARSPGAVAAPTASLHFDPELMASLTESGIRLSYVTLHVGAGTFLPIRSRNIENHRIHAERGELSEQAADEINRSLSSGQRVIAVGTTALRLIETAAREGRVRPWRGETGLFIRPGHKFSAATGLMTNFHLPNTTLLVLVAALIGKRRLKEVYSHAVASRYRFFSYGDSSLLLP